MQNLKAQEFSVGCTRRWHKQSVGSLLIPTSSSLVKMQPFEVKVINLNLKPAPLGHSLLPPPKEEGG